MLTTLHNMMLNSEKEVNNRPLIGVLSQVSTLSTIAGIFCEYQHTEVTFMMQPGEPAPEGMSYIAASYIKFIEVLLSALPSCTSYLLPLGTHSWYLSRCKAIHVA